MESLFVYSNPGTKGWKEECYLSSLCCWESIWSPWDHLWILGHIY